MYLITGGYDSKAKPAYVSTTEILTEGDSKWKVVGPLPLGIKAAKAVSVENSVFLTGKYRVSTKKVPSLFFGNNSLKSSQNSKRKVSFEICLF